MQSTINDNTISPAEQAFAEKTCEPLLKQVLPSDKLEAIIFGQTKPSGCAFLAFGTLSMATVKQYYIGITINDLLIIERDFWGRPGTIKRAPIMLVKSIKYSKGLLLDTVKIEMEEEPKILNLQVNFRLRGQSSRIESIFAKYRK
jgi:hypothetical protein